MSVQVISKDRQGYGAFNGGEIIENKPIGFPRDGGETKPFSNLFYWAYAEAKVDSTIGLHPHQGFEIMSFVLNGSIRHYDTQLKEWKPLSAGDAQIIRAGKGISHAEHMEKDSVMFQIWVDPDLNKTLSQPASYSDYKSADFPVQQFDGFEIKKYSGGDGPLVMDAPGLVIQEIRFEQSFEIEAKEDKVYAIYVRDGEMRLNGEKTVKDDFVIVRAAQNINIESTSKGNLFMIEAPAKVEYETYQEMMQKRMSN